MFINCTEKGYHDQKCEIHAIPLVIGQLVQWHCLVLLCPHQVWSLHLGKYICAYHQISQLNNIFSNSAQWNHVILLSSLILSHLYKFRFQMVWAQFLVLYKWGCMQPITRRQIGMKTIARTSRRWRWQLKYRCI